MTVQLERLDERVDLFRSRLRAQHLDPRMPEQSTNPDKPLSATSREIYAGPPVGCDRAVIPAVYPVIGPSKPPRTRATKSAQFHV